MEYLAVSGETGDSSESPAEAEPGTGGTGICGTVQAYTGYGSHAL